MGIFRSTDPSDPQDDPRVYSVSLLVASAVFFIHVFIFPILYFPTQLLFAIIRQCSTLLLEVESYKERAEAACNLIQRIHTSDLPPMRSLFLTGLAFVGAVCAQSSAVTSFLATEVPIAKAGMLANIGPSGSKASGAKVRDYEPEVDTIC